MRTLNTPELARALPLASRLCGTIRMAGRPKGRQAVRLLLTGHSQKLGLCVLVNVAMVSSLVLYFTPAWTNWFGQPRSQTYNSGRGHYASQRSHLVPGRLSATILC